MVSRLSDDELRQSLRDLGDVNVGPITPTTRSAMERRLGSLQKRAHHRTDHERLNALSSDDSEIESPSPQRGKKRASFKKPAPVPRSPPTPRAPPPKRQTTKRVRTSTFEVETSDSEFETPKLHRRPLASLGVSLSPVAPLPTMGPHSNHLYTPTLERLKKSTTNGFLPREEGEEPEEQGRSTEYSHCISWLIPAATVVFFVVIGLLYMSEVQKNTPNKSYARYCIGVNEDQCKPLILVSKELHYLLTKIAGDYECGLTSSRNMSIPDAKAHMKDLLSADDNFEIKQFDAIFEQSLNLFMKNSNWGIKCHTPESDSPSELGPPSAKSVIALEAEHGSKSLWCRARMALALTITKLLAVATVFGMCGAIYLAWCFWKRRREAQEKLFYEMVERVIDILREPSSEESGNCKAVVNVRDTLIPAKERKQREWLWERVVRFIEENESRVSVEFHTIHGEEFKVWRWNTPPEQNEGGKQGKVWQGQAFSSPEKGKPSTYSPTPCLKIRNMFDPEVEYGNDWQVSVKDAILEKCEGNNGIVHIAFDTTSNNEGCVFMMCSSSEAAGKAFDDLHGWWFDGKLVTVKYLKRTRYVERFPDSAHLSLPLRPSNDRRLSLSAPFFSSALERS